MTASATSCSSSRCSRCWRAAPRCGSLPLLRKFPLVAATAVVAAAAHMGVTAVTLARLHPLEYVAMNSLAGGTAGAAGRFELDYWSVAATEALRRLEHRLDHDASGRFAARRPRVLVCITNREWVADRLFRRNWVVVTDPAEADFIITTERWDCGIDSKMAPIDEVNARRRRLRPNLCQQPRHARISALAPKAGSGS